MRRIRKWILVSSIGLVLLLWICNCSINKYSNYFIFQEITKTPYNKCGLVLGTSNKFSDGSSNQYFYNRMDAAEQLYKNKRVSFLILSGDNRKVDYNEPLMMKKELLKRGVPDSVIILDFAGLRTFDSMVRCSEIFEQNSITVISQKFHNQRAIYIARKKGIKAIAFNAEDADANHSVKTKIREYFARVKVFIDLYFIPASPTHLGEKVKIG